MDDRKEPALQALADAGQAWDDSLVLTRYTPSHFRCEEMRVSLTGEYVRYTDVQAYTKTLAAENAALIARDKFMRDQALEDAVQIVQPD